MRPDVWQLLPDAEKERWRQRFRDERQGVRPERREQDWTKAIWTARDQYRVENALLGCGFALALVMVGLALSVLVALGL